MSKTFWAILAVIVVVLIGVFSFTGHKSGNTANVSVTNHLIGQNKAGVTLLEYGDYQCPACGEYYPILKQVQQKYNEQIHFQFRNFPLTSLHPNAFAGARAAEAADLQGKFWQMHDKLYDENDLYYLAQQQGRTYNTWIGSNDPLSFFSQYAQQLGLNVTQFKQDFASDKVNSIVNADLNEANKLNLSATPSFFLDGKKLDNVQPTVDAFSKLLDAEITKKGGTPPASTTTTQTQQ